MIAARIACPSCHVVVKNHVRAPLSAACAACISFHPCPKKASDYRVPRHFADRSAEGEETGLPCRNAQGIALQREAVKDGG